MLCHFGNQELQDQSGKELNRVFSHFYRLSDETVHAIESCLPFNQLFLQDYTGLEKLLVLINVVLFGASLNAGDLLEPNVAIAILYIMFTILYFVVTSTCLTSAAMIKACFGDQTQIPTPSTSLKELTLQIPHPNFSATSDRKSGKVGVAKKQQTGAKGNRKTALN